MAMTIGTPSVGTSATTLSHTTVSGDKVLVFGIVTAEGSGWAIGTPPAFNSDNMTESGAGSTDGGYLYYLVNPDIGAHSIDFTLTGTPGSVNTFAVSLGADVETATSPLGDTGTNTGTGAVSITLDPTAVGDFCVIIGQGGGDITPGAGLTNLFESAADSVSRYAGYKVAAGTTTTLGYTWSSNSRKGTAMTMKYLLPVAYTIPLSHASFTLTGVNLAFLIGHILTAAVATFSLTGITQAFTFFPRWLKADKNASSFSNSNRNSASYSNASKSSSTFTNLDLS